MKFNSTMTVSPLKKWEFMSMIKKIFFTLVLLNFLQPPLFSFVGDWTAITYLNSCIDIAKFSNKLYIGTTGGLREINPQTLEETVYNNPQEGFWDVNITGLIADESKLVVVTKNGLVYTKDTKGKWRFFDRNFKAYNWLSVPRSLALRKNLLVLGTTKSLSFFDLEQGVVMFSLQQIQNIKDPTVTALHIEGEDLYIATISKVFRTKIYWDNPSSPPNNFVSQNGSIFNPLSWKEVSVNWRNNTPADTIRQIEVNNEQVTVSRGGSKSSNFTAYLGEPLQIGSFSSSNTEFSKALEVSNKIFILGNKKVLLYNNNNLDPVNPETGLPQPHNVLGVYTGESGTYLWQSTQPPTVSNIYTWKNNGFDSLVQLTFEYEGEPLGRYLEMIQFEKENVFHIATWGNGLGHFERTFTFDKGEPSSCLESYPGINSYFVTTNSVKFQNQGIFFGQALADDPYTLNYYDFQSDRITCFNRSPQIKASFINDIKIASGLNNEGEPARFLLTGHNKGVSLYIIENTGSKSGLTLQKNFNLGGAEQEVLATVLDQYDRLWASTTSGIYYLNNASTSSDTEMVNLGDVGAEFCHYSIQDANQNLWWGCANGLFQVVPANGNTPLTSFKKYGNRDGLLGEMIRYMSYNKSNGQIWMSTDNGVSIFEADARETPSSQPSLKVYPNPFRPQHSFVLFDNLPKDPTITILSEAGWVVKRAKGQYISGWQWRWDGTNQSGKRVSPGIYLYTVESGDSVTRGKLIVGR